MQVKVQKKESIIVKVMRTALRRQVHTPRESILIIHNINGPNNFFRTIKDNQEYADALGTSRTKAYFRCICDGDPMKTLPKIIEEIPVEDLPKS